MMRVLLPSFVLCVCVCVCVFLVCWSLCLLLCWCVCVKLLSVLNELWVCPVACVLLWSSLCVVVDGLLCLLLEISCWVGFCWLVAGGMLCSCVCCGVVPGVGLVVD